jgi:hypothetical protein
MKKFFYYIADDEELEDCTPLTTRFDEDPIGAAELAAKDHYDNHDGWDSSWPMSFVILGENKEPLGRFLVDMEDEPVFSASEEAELMKKIEEECLP